MRESKLQKEILAAIGAEPDFYILVNACGMADYVDDHGATWKVPYGLERGSPDLVGMLEVPGRGCAAWVALEVKRPGKNPERHQAACHARWRARGALVYAVRSVADARAALADARARVRGAQ